VYEARSEREVLERVMVFFEGRALAGAPGAAQTVSAVLS
jgi:hypothetical protein